MTATPPSLQLVVGLGNPGPPYARTRHNAGFWWVDEVARRHGGSFRPESKFAGEVCRITVDGHDVWLLKPMAFMNRSGQSIASLAGFYRIPPAAILIAHDDLDLPPGVARLKRGGGHGGHNGLRDAMHHLGSGDFLRLRLGIGHPGSSDEVVNYVLRPAPANEQQLIERALEDAAGELPRLLEGQMEKAMQVLHSRRGDAADTANG